ncbi:hypothetical protein EDC04DRAFT_2779978 [Pisolithus marmoratus]|nr:hypothetical protein EDC04DRAFT_2779978 [Pisolithus marmoratus]
MSHLSARRRFSVLKLYAGSMIRCVAARIMRATLIMIGNSTHIPRLSRSRSSRRNLMSQRTTTNGAFWRKASLERSCGFVGVGFVQKWRNCCRRYWIALREKEI